MTSCSPGRGGLSAQARCDRNRARAEVSAPSVRTTRARWLFVRGRGARPLPAPVDPAAICTHSSSKRPSVQRGDLAILYAAVWQAVFGVVEVVSDPENDPGRERWGWSFGIRPLAAVADLHHAPAVEEAGVFPQSLWRHSHIRLTPGQFEQARLLVEARAASPGR
jgi:hypothetical protein